MHEVTSYVNDADAKEMGEVFGSYSFGLKNKLCDFFGGGRGRGGAARELGCELLLLLLLLNLCLGLHNTFLTP